MNTIFLRDLNDKKITPELVRYFKYQNDYYLIYTFHEVDEKNFMTLYVVKVLEELGQPVAKTLSNDWEWQNMQVVVKQMLREIKRNQILSFEDMDIETIQGMKVISARSFKLLSSLVQILSGEVVEHLEEETSIPTPMPEKIESPMETLIANEKSNQLSVEDKIELLNQLKHKYPFWMDQKNLSPICESLNLSDITPISANGIIENIEDTCDISEDIPEIFEDSMTDDTLYRKLKEENELLKQQLLQYQTKYQMIKDLLLKD